MTDIAWISLAVMVVVTALSILLVVLLVRRQKNFRLSFPVPFMEGTFELSPHDSERVHLENMLRLKKDLFDKFLKITEGGNRINHDSIREADPMIIQKMLCLNLLHSEEDSIDPDKIQLGYLGWQALENWIKQTGRDDKPKIEPWSWLEDYQRS